MSGSNSFPPTLDEIEADSIFELARKLELADRESLGEDEEIQRFKPAEAVWIIDALFSRSFGRGVGVITAIIYAMLTNVFIVSIWLSFFYLRTFFDTARLDGSTWALFSVTIGTFVLISGSNLVEHYDEKDLNFPAYVHNSITFVSAGILFALSHIIDAFFDPSFRNIREIIPSITLYGINLFATLLFVLSIWVLLKILWRLSQLVRWESNYTDKGPYSEFTATFAGFYYGFQQGMASREDSRKLSERRFHRTRVVLSLIIIIASISIPIYITSKLWMGLVGLISTIIVLNILKKIYSIIRGFMKTESI